VRTTRRTVSEKEPFPFRRVDSFVIAAFTEQDKGDHMEDNVFSFARRRFTTVTASARQLLGNVYASYRRRARRVRIRPYCRPAVQALEERLVLDGGYWGPVTKWPVIGIHAIMLPTGNVMVLADGQSSYRIWRPDTNTFTTPQPIPFNHFCSGNIILPDGTVFFHRRRHVGRSGGR